MVAADARTRWRVIIGSLLRREFVERRSGQQLLRSQSTAKQRPARSHRHAIQKIAPSDLAIHPQFAIALFPAKALVVHEAPARIRWPSILRRPHPYTISVRLPRTSGGDVL